MSDPFDINNLSKSSQQGLIQLFCRDSTDSESLREVALDLLVMKWDQWVLDALAMVGGNRNTPPDALIRIQEYEDLPHYVISAVVGNTNLPVEILDSWKTTPSTLIKDRLVYNPSTGTDALRYLYDHEENGFIWGKARDRLRAIGLL